MRIERRLSKEEEYKMMYPESNSKNLKDFEEYILPYFFYNKESNKRIIDRLHEVSSDNDYLDSLLKLNSQKRAFYLLKKEASNDEIYKKYYSLILKYIPNTMPEINNITNYDNFINNKITIGKQQFKLIKYLIDKKGVPKEEIEKITSLKNSKNDVYLCLTRNPIDYLFASTNQSFSSCISLDYNCSHNMGLGGLCVDPNRFMLFLTSGAIRRYTLREKEIKHFRYIARTWCLLGKDDYIKIVRQYPSNSIETKSIFEDLKLNFYSDTDFTSKFSFKPVLFENGNIAMIYLDTIGVKYDYLDNTAYYSCNNYNKIYDIIDFDCSYNFNNIQSFDDLEDICRYICCVCDERLHEDNVYASNGDVYCEYHYYQNFYSCERCGYECYLEDGGYEQEKRLCNSCFYDSYFVCENCDSITELDDSFEDSKGSLLCEDCFFESNIICDACNKVVSIGDKIEDNSGICFCEDCYDNLYVSCTKCGEETLIEDSVINNQDIIYCSNCYDELYTKCGVCDEEIEIEYAYCIFCSPKIELSMLEEDNIGKRGVDLTC